MIQQNLRNRKERFKVDNAYHLWKEIFYGIPQCPILDPRIFNILLCDLFYTLDGVTVAKTMMIPHLIVLTKQIV